MNEGNLRQHFTKERLVFDENQILFEAGARGAATLANVQLETINIIADFGSALAESIQSMTQGSGEILPKQSLSEEITAEQQARWVALQDWLSTLPLASSTHN